MFQLGLRSRVAVVFGALSMVVALLISSAIYLVSRTYLTNQRESAGLTRALLDAKSVDAAIAGGVEPLDALGQLPVAGTSQALIRVDGEWLSRGSQVEPSSIPRSLIDLAVAEGGAQQRFALDKRAYYGVGVDTPSGLYVELFPLTDLLNTLAQARTLLLILTVAAFVIGGGVGRYMGGRLMRPLQRLGAGARQLAAGDLTVRLPETGDPDLDPISDSFNEMAVAVASRIDRERRFVANVSHELRSPMTTVVATAELLEAHRESFGPREARLVTTLAGQARRLTRILLDLLEIASVTAAAPVQKDATDVVATIDAVLASRDLPMNLVRGDRPTVVTDARRIERVVTNLVDNANRHGGGVRQILVMAEDGHVYIHIDDAGPGVSPEQVERLFEPFARGERAAQERIEGAGLGLAISREQAEAIGGRLLVSTSPMGGARFTLDLPVGVPL